MTRLSNIFKSLEKQNSFEIQKRKYFASKLVESYMLVESGGNSNIIDNKLFTEAIRYGSEKKAIKFLKDVEREVLQEGIWDNIKSGAKKAASWVGDKIKGVVDKVKGWFKGPVQKALDNFNTAIKPGATKLMSEGVVKESFSENDAFKEKLLEYTQNNSGVRKKRVIAMLLESVANSKKEKRIPIDYLFELAPAGAPDPNATAPDPNATAPDPNATAPDPTPTDAGNPDPNTTTPDAGEEAPADDGEEGQGDAGVAAMAAKLFSGKKVETGKKTGSSQKSVKFYAITKAGVNSTLWIGPSNTLDQMKILLVYMGSSGKLFLNLDPTIVGSLLEMELITNLLLAIKNNPKLNPNEAFGSVTQAGKKIVLDHNGKKVILFPGKLAIVNVGAKSTKPIKLKNAADQGTLKKTFGIKDVTDTSDEVNADNTAADDKKPVKGEPGFETETDDEFKVRMDAWSDGKDDADFKASSDDGTEKDYKVGLAQQIHDFFGIDQNDLDLFDIDNPVEDKNPDLKIDDINTYNVNLNTLLEYYAGDDGKMEPNDQEEIAIDFAAITQITYKNAVKRSLDEVDTTDPAKALDAKKVILDDGIRLVAELKKIAGKYGVNFEFNSSNWDDISEGIQLTDYNDEDNFGSLDAVDDEGNRINAEGKRIDAEGNVIPDAEGETPALDAEGNPIPGEEDAGEGPKEVEPLEEPEPGTEAPVVDEKTWMTTSIKSSGVMNSETKLLKKMQVDSGSLWKNFAGFAAKHRNDLPAVMLATDGKADYAPMSENEYIGYAANLDTLLGHIRKEVNDNKLSPQMYDKQMFMDFISGSALPAAIELSKGLTGLVFNKANDVGKPEETKPVVGEVPPGEEVPPTDPTTGEEVPPTEPEVDPTPVSEADKLAAIEAFKKQVF